MGCERQHEAPLASAPEELTAAQAYLSELGYFQMQHLPISGTVDEQTWRDFDKPRCGISDLDASHFWKSGPRAPARWEKSTVTLAVDPDAPGWTRDVAREASRVWQSQVPLSLQWVDAFHTADIQISFTPDRHGDGASLQPPTVAHAFAPGTRWSGNVHFRAATKWASTMTQGVLDLQTYMIHELGHALGLGHSSESASIMRAQPRNGQRELSPRDIVAIKALYSRHD
ncbi:matrixin family metalloprotease [Hyalangium sp.]|uniref:matrixin family metalloprotease n=1 Tax=Hyalangium sp. TaxID=2028555 RepID=UPI002D64D958|nr:matrixin family metalloprotease [Hyalangium sp.]HYH99651.1 matrixin family metalloprotease [Hyalangium sp.]